MQNTTLSRCTSARLWLPVVLFSLVQFSLTGCMGPKKLDKWVGEHYGETVPNNKAPQGYVSFVVTDSVPSGEVSHTEKTHHSFVPALLYWQWNHTMLSAVNAALLVKDFSTAFIPYANSKGLPEKLNGNTLQLGIPANPANFTFTQKGHVIFLLLYYISSESIYIVPDKNRLSFPYKVMNGSQEVKSGTITIENRNRETGLKAFQSTRKMTRHYLETADENIKIMTQDLVDKLMYEM